MSISFAITGVDALKTAMEKYKKHLKERKRVNGQAVILVDRWIQKNFQTEGGNVGGWRPLSQATIEARRKGKNRRGSVRILQDTGEMRRNWKHIYSDTEAKIVSGVPYSIKHEEGDGVPQRRILPTPEEIWPQLEKLYTLFIQKAFKL